jgi:hypothetical protein
MLVLYLVRLHALVVIRPRRMQEIDRSQDVLVQLGVHGAPRWTEACRKAKATTQ